MNISETVKPTLNARKILSHPIYCLAFGLGSGLSPKAPGTAGTLMAIPLYFLLSFLPPVGYAAVLLITFFIGIYLCGKTADYLGVHDHGGIVWDEFVGFWLTMFLVPPTWYWIILGFVLFRLFDILKPWPIKKLDQHVPGGLGIMIDDVLAGIYALVILQLIVVMTS